MLQGMKLRAVLSAKAEQKAHLEQEIERLGYEAERLESSRVTQEREIRRVLGYAGSDEIIFVFPGSS